MATLAIAIALLGTVAINVFGHTTRSTFVVSVVTIIVAFSLVGVVWLAGCAVLKDIILTCKM